MAGKKSLLEVHVLDAGPPTVLRAAGVLDISTVDALDREVRPHLAPGARVVVDISDVTMCDSTGLGAVVRLERSARIQGCTFALRGPRPVVADVLAMTGIDQVVPVLRPAQTSSGDS